MSGRKDATPALGTGAQRPVKQVEGGNPIGSRVKRFVQQEAAPTLIHNSIIYFNYSNFALE